MIKDKNIILLLVMIAVALLAAVVIFIYSQKSAPVQSNLINVNNRAADSATNPTDTAQEAEALQVEFQEEQRVLDAQIQTDTAAVISGETPKTPEQIAQQKKDLEEYPTLPEPDNDTPPEDIESN